MPPSTLTSTFATFALSDALPVTETAPLTEVYSARGLLVQVDGMGSVDEVFGRISAALEGVARS